MESNMFVVTREGYKLPVDTSSIPDDGRYSFQQNVGLYDNSTTLKPVWIIQLQKSNCLEQRLFELEFIKELKYEYEPTQEELLYLMSAYGLSRFDIVTIQKGYELDIKFEDCEEYDE